MAKRKKVSRSARASKAVKASRAAKRVLKRVEKHSLNPVRPSTGTTLDDVEADRTKARLARFEETKKRNTGSQGQPRSKRQKKRNSAVDSDANINLHADQKDFYEAIDRPLLRVCGSCGELANSFNAIRKLYDPTSNFFTPLRNHFDVVDVIPEGLFEDTDGGVTSIWLCDRCNRALLAKSTPKFSRASGFRIASVPNELAVLNRMETRLIGLGISFTTCVNLYKDGQEFTRGNAINYWNDPAETVRELPRPLRECGVVLLASTADSTTNHFKVRPDLIRRALVWLISNNPLYEGIRISENNLNALEDLDIRHEIPTINVTDEEVKELRGHPRQVNLECEPSVSTMQQDVTSSLGCNASFSPIEYSQASTSGAGDDSTCTTCESGMRSIRESPTGTTVTFSLEEETPEDILENLTESFELEGNNNGKVSELERIMNVVGVDNTDSDIPTGELRCCEDPINEYTTKQLMQCCFPTLFPDGCGGYQAIDGHENRLHDYTLSEFCAHLMKWHDRRYIIHGNFKFFCMNLIQRRQIDGLVRRVAVTETRSAAIDAVGSERLDRNDTTSQAQSQSEKEELRAAMQVLDSLKPFFRVVRGSGLYWSNARDDLMAMIGNRVLPTRWPTFFLTLSAADTIWPDFARACDPSLTLDQCRRLSFCERRKYLNENPDISARHFNRRFQAFFDTVLCGRAKPLGEIIDFFWRVEFQQRGSPHIHCLLWIKDAPDVLELSKTSEGRARLAEFVDRHISVLSKTLKELDTCTCSSCVAYRSGDADVLALRPPVTGTEAWKYDLSRLVRRVQQHECYPNSSCRKKANECRFGFPKSLQKNTEIESSVAFDGTPSLKVHLKREVSTINNYSPHLLSSWRANMDLQLIGNSYGAAEYAGAYISKAEPDTLRFRRVIARAIQRSDPNLSYHSTLKRVANATLSVREVGAPEAVYILLRNLPMHRKSRSIVKLKALRHDRRVYRVAPRGVEGLAALVDDSNTNNIRIELVERAYMNRPIEPLFENMSLATFVEEYELLDSLSANKVEADVWKRIDEEGWIKRRQKAVVVQKSPWMRPDSSNPCFCFSEVFLYVPWRRIRDLPSSDEECIARFYDAQQLQGSDELQQEANAKLARQHQLDLLKSSHTACSVSSFPPSEYVFIDNNGSNGSDGTDETRALLLNADNSSAASPTNDVEWKCWHDYSVDTVAKARDFVKVCLKPWLRDQKEARTAGKAFRKGDDNQSHYKYPIADDSGSTQEIMADSQWIPFALGMQQSRNRFRASLDKSKCEPLRMRINGEGGSGKSWLIRHLVKDVHNVFGEHRATRCSSKRVLLLAHQGTAAFNIKGQTICSALGFSSFSKSAFSVPYKSILDSKSGHTKLKSMQQQFEDVHLVVIDEFSMISCGMLYWIDRRMREIWPDHSDELFGGRDVYFVGDAAQLDPVVPSALSTPIAKISNDVQRRGREIWTSIESVVTLTSQNRGIQDPAWFNALRRLREREPTQADVDLFNSRCQKTIGKPEWSSRAKHIAYRNVDVASANENLISQAAQPIITTTSQHFVQQKRLSTKRDIPSGTVSALVDDAKQPNADHDRVVANRLKLCIGAPVTLTFNMAQGAGLCNGTNAVVYDFMFVSGSELPIVLVQITDTYLGPSLLDNVPNIVPIVPKDISWGKRTSDLRVVRRGIPLRLAYAMTVHKVQGLTCAYVVFHSNPIPSIAFTYVALSRITHRASIVLTEPLRIDKLTASPEKLAAFRDEEARVSCAVQRTIDAATSVVDRMKEVALAHNNAILPRL